MPAAKLLHPTIFPAPHLQPPRTFAVKCQRDQFQVRLLSTEAATNTTVSTSAITLTAACGDGFHPRSANPKSPTVRDSANATSAPAESAVDIQVGVNDAADRERGADGQPDRHRDNR